LSFLGDGFWKGAQEDKYKIREGVTILAMLSEKKEISVF
jgi:hypothetical protein